MPDRTSQTLSFDDDNTNYIVLATATKNDSCLFERLFPINNVFSATSSKTVSMSSTKSPKNTSSNGVPQARPFDEFSANITSTSTNILDGQSFDTTKSDKY